MQVTENHPDPEKELDKLWEKHGFPTWHDQIVKSSPVAPALESSMVRWLRGVASENKDLLNALVIKDPTLALRLYNLTGDEQLGRSLLDRYSGTSEFKFEMRDIERDLNPVKPYQSTHSLSENIDLRSASLVKGSGRSNRLKIKGGMQGG